MHGEVFSAIGGIALIVAVLISIRRWLFVRRASRATGVVTDHKVQGGRTIRGESGKTRRSSPTYFPVIEFPSAVGSVTFTSNAGFSNPLPRGQQVQVLYDPERPQRAEIDRPDTLWGHARIWLVVALIFGTLGLLMLNGLLEIG